LGVDKIHVLKINDKNDETPLLNTRINATYVDIKQSKISINALIRVVDFRTMRVTSYHNKKPLHVLIDNGSTHNFLDINVAKKLRHKITKLDPLNAIMADGNRLQISSVVKDFSQII